MWSSSRPGRRDDDLGAGAERALLRPHVDAADHRDRRDADVVAERQRLLVDLHRELARRRRGPARGILPCGLPFSRWRIGSRNAAVLPVPVDAQPIRSRPGQDDRDGLGLDGVGRVYPMSAHRFGECRNEVELVSRHARRSQLAWSAASTHREGRSQRPGVIGERYCHNRVTIHPPPRGSRRRGIPCQVDRASLVSGNDRRDTLRPSPGPRPMIRRT